LRLLVVSFERVVSWIRGESINGAARTLDSKEHKMHGEYKTPGGKLVMADLDVRDGKLKDVEVSGDFFLEPPEALSGITDALEDAPADLAEEDLAERIRDGVGSDVEMIGFSAESVARAVRRALA
jgi:hypothetical protein